MFLNYLLDQENQFHLTKLMLIPDAWSKEEKLFQNLINNYLIF